MDVEEEIFYQHVATAVEHLIQILEITSISADTKGNGAVRKITSNLEKTVYRECRALTRCLFYPASLNGFFNLGLILIIGYSENGRC